MKEVKQIQEIMECNFKKEKPQFSYDDIAELIDNGEIVRCPNCSASLELADCECYDEDRWYCTPTHPNKLCSNGAIFCPECEWPTN